MFIGYFILSYDLPKSTGSRQSNNRRTYSYQSYRQYSRLPNLNEHGLIHYDRFTVDLEIQIIKLPKISNLN